MSKSQISSLPILCVCGAVAIGIVLLCYKTSKSTQSHASKVTHGNMKGQGLNPMLRTETIAQPVPYYSEGLFHDSSSRYFNSVESVGDLPIACVATLGGDIMMCPASGICPLNGERCQPSTNSKPCCNDAYPPKETWYYPDRPLTDDYMYMS